jgi:hypothetical protein
MRNTSAFQPKSATGLNRGLVSYWRFDESSGNASDSVGSNTLTNVNGATYTTGKIGNGADLELSSTQYFSITDAAQSGLEFLTGDFSISMWVNFESLSDLVGLWDKWNSVSNRRSILWQISSTGMTLDTSANGSAQTNYSASHTFTTSTWYHLVLVKSGTTATFYVDGTAKTSGSATSTLFNNTLDIRIGNRQEVSKPLDGILDEVGVWNRALTSDEITELYNSTNGIQLPSQALTTKAYYPLNGNSRDFSGNGNTGTDTAITYPQGRFGQAARFNGSSSVIGIPYNGLNFEYNNSFTFSCWTQITTSAGEFAFFSNLKNDSTLRGWEVNKAFNSPNVGFYLLSNWDGGSGPRLAVQFNTNLVKNKLVNLVITYSGNSLASGVKCYVDGIPQTVASSAETLSTNTTVHTDNPKLGARISGVSRLNGLLDEVIIESRAWTAKEVETYYRKSMLNYSPIKKSALGTILDYIYSRFFMFFN